MSDRAKRIITSISATFPLAWLAVPFLAMFLFKADSEEFFVAAVTGEGTTEPIIYFAVFFGSGALMMVLVSKLGYPLRQVRAKKFSLSVSNFEEFNKRFAEAVIKSGYKEKARFVPVNKYRMRVFARKFLFIHWDYLFFVSIAENTGNEPDEIEDLYWKFRKDHYENFGGLWGRFVNYTEYTTHTYILCIDKMTPEFYFFANSNAAKLHYHNFFRLLAEVAFDDGIVYISRHKDGPGTNIYNRLTRQFLKIMGNMTEQIIAEEMYLSLSNNDEFENQFSASAIKHDYDEYIIADDNPLQARIFAKSNIDILYCLIIIRACEFTEEELDGVNDLINRFLDFYRKEATQPFRYTSLIPVICVDRMTPILLRYINGETAQMKRPGLIQLPAGIHINDGTVYLGVKKYEQMEAEYKTMREEFMSIMKGIAILYIRK